MILLKADFVDDAYLELLSLFSNSSLELRDSRLGPTFDLGPVAIDLAPGLLKLLSLPGRAINPYLAIIESSWVLAGQNDLATLTFVVERFRKFSDDGKTLGGAYGKRLRSYFGFDQIENAVNQFRADPLSRRVFLDIASPDDAKSSSLDVPCNIGVMFQRRFGSLDMTVINRSNDLIFGLPYDIFVFAVVHAHVAMLIECPLGRHLHISNCLHLYKQNQDIAARALHGGRSEVVLTEAEVASFMDELLSSHQAIAKLDFDAVTSPRLRRLLTGFEMYKAGKQPDLENSFTDDWLGRMSRCWFERPRSSIVATVAM